MINQAYSEIREGVEQGCASHNSVSKATATRLLQALSEMVLVRRGVGAGAYYCFK